MSPAPNPTAPPIRRASTTRRRQAREIPGVRDGHRHSRRGVAAAAAAAAAVAVAVAAAGAILSAGRASLPSSPGGRQGSARGQPVAGAHQSVVARETGALARAGAADVLAGRSTPQVSVGTEGDAARPGRTELRRCRRARQRRCPESGQRLCRDGLPDGLSGCHRRDAGRDAEEFSVVAAGGGAVRDTMFR